MKYKNSTFKSIGSLVEPLVKKHGKADIISYFNLSSIWETLVGEEISERAQPIKLKTIEGGRKNILFLGMTGPYLAEMSLRVPDVIAKVNLYYSKEVISQIKLQRIPGPVYENVIEFESSSKLETEQESDSHCERTNDAMRLEHALKIMKNNLYTSRKKNEFMAD